jgi:hypothetical protein
MNILYICTNVYKHVSTSMYTVMCEITTEEGQLTTSQRANSVTTIRSKYVTFSQMTFHTVHRWQTEAVKWTVNRQLEVIEHMKR